MFARKISIISGNNRLLDTKEKEWRRNSECLEFSKSKVFDGCGYRENNFFFMSIYPKLLPSNIEYQLNMLYVFM